MSLFGKIFGSKTTADRGAAGKKAAAPAGGDFLAALSMQLRGEVEPALSAYLSITAALPSDPLARLFAATIQAELGNTPQAAEGLRVLSQQVADAGENISQAIILELAAQVKAGPVVVSIPAISEIIVRFGDLLKKEGFLREGAVSFEIAASLLPDHANVLHRLGDTLHDLRIYEYAESVFLEALTCAPNHWGALYSYAVLLQDLGRDEEAINYYEKAATFDPSHAKCQNNYGAALLRTNRLEEALSHCTIAAGLDPDSPFVKINLGNIHLLKGEYETARAFFTDAITVGGDLAPAYFGLASVEQALQGDPGAVRELFLKSLEINPSIAEAHQAVGNLLAAGDDPEALSHFTAAVRLNERLRNLHRDFGHAWLRFGQREEGLYHLNMAIQQNPDDLELQMALAKVAQGESA